MSNRNRWIIGAVCVLYIAVRVWRLADSCLWFDEIFSVHAAEHSWNSLLWFVAQDLIHPPLFYIILKIWIAIGGESVTWLRLLPVFFSVLALIPFFHLGREFKLERSVITFGMFLFAVNGALIKYTQTLRMYSMLMFLALASIWLFARYFNRGKSFVPLLITNFLLVYTHYYGWLVVGTEIAALMIFQRIKWRRAVVMTGILCASYVPWVWAILKAAGEGSDVVQNIAWQPRPYIFEVVNFFIDLVEPIYFQASSAQPQSIYAISVPTALILIGALDVYLLRNERLVMVIVLAISIALALTLFIFFSFYVISIPLFLMLVAGVIVYLIRWDDEDGQGVKLLLLFVSIPLVVTFTASWLLPQSVWGTRHLIVVFPPALLLIGNAVWKVGNEIARIVLVAAMVFLSGVAIVAVAVRQPPRYVWCAWNDVAADIRAAEPDGPVKIYTFENLVAYHVWFALRDSDRFKIAVVKGIDVKTDDETYFLPRGFDDVERADINWINDDRFWLAFRTSVAGDDLRLIGEFQDRGYSICDVQDIDYGNIVFRTKLVRKGLPCN